MRPDSSRTGPGSPLLRSQSRSVEYPHVARPREDTSRAPLTRSSISRTRVGARPSVRSRRLRERSQRPSKQVSRIQRAASHAGTESSSASIAIWSRMRLVGQSWWPRRSRLLRLRKKRCQACSNRLRSSPTPASSSRAYSVSRSVVSDAGNAAVRASRYAKSDSRPAASATPSSRRHQTAYSVPHRKRWFRSARCPCSVSRRHSLARSARSSSASRTTPRSVSAGGRPARSVVCGLPPTYSRKLWW